MDSSIASYTGLKILFSRHGQQYLIESSGSCAQGVTPRPQPAEQYLFILYTRNKFEYSFDFTLRLFVCVQKIDVFQPSADEIKGFTHSIHS